MDERLSVVILVPRRDDNGWRDHLWRFCRQWWVDHHAPMPIFEGYHLAEEGPFNRSLAINRASAMADAWLGRPWDIALIIDSDTISGPEAVQEALRVAHETGALTIAHTRRYMLSRNGTKQVLAGDMRNWKNRSKVWRMYQDSVSCAVGVSRATWDLAGGFDERFVGWGFEDTAFRMACETFTGKDIVTIPGDCFHLWHPTSPEASHNAPTYAPNKRLKERYVYARWKPELMRRVLSPEPDVLEEDVTIPKILHRTVPKKTSAEVERWWRKFAELHPDWDLRTYREPIDPADWPLTGDLFEKCQNGAQKAGLIRLEAVYTHGGIYVDSDVEPFRPFDPLLQCRGFAAWEDEKVVPDAVMGAVPNHPAWLEMLTRARGAVEWGSDAWVSGPGGTTAILPGRDDVILFPPGAFYPAHYLEKGNLGKSGHKPWVFAEHKWHHSWGSPEAKAAIAKRQRVEVPEPVEQPEVASSFVICMPWRPNGDRYRLAAYEWCKRWWKQAGFTVIEGAGPSRATMCNDAARKALRLEGVQALVFADADTWTMPGQVIESVRFAISSGVISYPFASYVKVGQATSARYQQQRKVTTAMVARGAQPKPNHVSGLVVVPTALWGQIGGFDERFVGWGFEDQAFHLAATTIGGGNGRGSGVAIHWYHKPDPTKVGVKPDDERLKIMERYCLAAGAVPLSGRVARYVEDGLIVGPFEATPSPQDMIAVLSEDGGPLASRPVSAAM